MTKLLQVETLELVGTSWIAELVGEPLREIMLASTSPAVMPTVHQASVCSSHKAVLVPLFLLE